MRPNRMAGLALVALTSLAAPAAAEGPDAPDDARDEAPPDHAPSGAWGTDLLDPDPPGSGCRPYCLE